MSEIRTDFNRNYIDVSAGVTVGGGSVAYLKNEHCVVIKLEAATVGLRFDLSGESVKVRVDAERQTHP